MKHELEMFRRDTTAVMRRAQRLVEGLPPEEVARRPSPSEWSVGECLDHLTITARAYQPMVEKATAQRAPLSESEYRPSWIWRKFIEALEPPVKRKFKAAPAFLPTEQRTAPEVLKDFLEAHKGLLASIPRLEALDLGKIRIVSPFAAWMRYPLGLVFLIVPAHCRRHLWQAEQVVERLPLHRERANPARFFHPDSDR